MPDLNGSDSPGGRDEGRDVPDVPDGDALIERLGLAPHPEGGWYRRTMRTSGEGRDRPLGSAIYYLLRAGEESLRHRIDAVEVWHHCLGDPLELVLEDDCGTRHHRLGPDLAAGQRPQVIVPRGTWQSARPVGRFTLVACTVSPAFVFETLEIDHPAKGEPR